MTTTTERLLPGWDELMALPALVEGHSVDLRLQTHESRVWTARGGLSNGEPYEHTVYVETLRRAAWYDLGHYDGDDPPRSLPGFDRSTLTYELKQQRAAGQLARVRAFLDAYPNDGSTNIPPERIYTFNTHTLNWSDLDALCSTVEALSHNGVRSDDG